MVTTQMISPAVCALTMATPLADAGAMDHPVSTRAGLSGCAVECPALTREAEVSRGA